MSPQLEVPVSLLTTDLSDAFPDEVGHLDPILAHFGGEEVFHGPVRTLKCFEDNSLVRELLASPGDGAVLVVDGGGSTRCALVGGNLGALAAANGWAGVIVYGCVRDSVELADCPVGVMALAPHPRKSVKRGEGQVDLEVTFGGVTFAPGSWVYADTDGVIVAPRRLPAE
ncbi:MAG: ribonuclease E activity regulator RraA [Myxococcales bacterium]|nr:ribonuclease E activity regulator RraA [Myxococcales bacterium]MCB9664031.1 ribonuclease E activity regulator RraA [Alphaproteobacteria bacterium]